MKPIVVASTRPWNEYLAKEINRAAGIPTYLVKSKTELNQQYLEALNPEYIFFPHWSHMIPPDVYEKYECIIFHMTDLPFGRGGSPLQNLIQRGYENTKISAIRCVPELDGGPVYLKKDLNLNGSASEIFLRASKIIKQMILEIIEKKPVPVPQKGEVVVFKRRSPEQSNIKTAQIRTLDDFFDFIRMLDAEGYPKAFLNVHSFKVEFTRVQREPNGLYGSFSIHIEEK